MIKDLDEILKFKNERLDSILKFKNDETMQTPEQTTEPLTSEPELTLEAAPEISPEQIAAIESINSSAKRMAEETAAEREITAKAAPKKPIIHTGSDVENKEEAQEIQRLYEYLTSPDAQKHEEGIPPITSLPIWGHIRDSFREMTGREPIRKMTNRERHYEILIMPEFWENYGIPYLKELFDFDHVLTDEEIENQLKELKVIM